TLALLGLEEAEAGLLGRRSCVGGHIVGRLLDGLVAASNACGSSQQYDRSTHGAPPLRPSLRGSAMRVKSTDRLAALLFLEQVGDDVAVGAQAHGVTLNVGHQA